MQDTLATPTLRTTTVELPEPFDPRWNRLPGITVDGATITIDPDAYFFRFDTAVSWKVCDWSTVRAKFLDAAETAETALEQMALDFIAAHGRTTSDAAEVLATAWQVYAYLFRDDLLPVAGLAQIGPAELRMLREAATLMALNKVELDGSISTIGLRWFFPAATSVVFDLDDRTGGMLDEVYHGTWFTEHRRIESIKAHVALGGRLVHGCQSVPNQSGGPPTDMAKATWCKALCARFAPPAVRAGHSSGPQRVRGQGVWEQGMWGFGGCGGRSPPPGGSGGEAPRQTWRRRPGAKPFAHSSPIAERPRQDSNLRTRLRRAVLYPLSYGGNLASRHTVPVENAGPGTRGAVSFGRVHRHPQGPRCRRRRRDPSARGRQSGAGGFRGVHGGRRRRLPRTGA
jgi:hypothetical protein